MILFLDWKEFIKTTLLRWGNATVKADEIPRDMSIIGTSTSGTSTSGMVDKVDSYKLITNWLRPSQETTWDVQAETQPGRKRRATSPSMAQNKRRVIGMSKLFGTDEINLINHLHALSRFRFYRRNRNRNRT
jgi:hypothetical protein